jgi:hypothetical protein
MPTRASILGGRNQRSFDMPPLSCSAGSARASTAPPATNSVSQGWCTTKPPSARQNASSRRRPPLRRMIGSQSMRGPSSTSAAGRSVRAASTDTHTTIAPPTPTLRVSMIGLSSRPSRPMITVTPDQEIVRPARATVTATLSGLVAPAACSR